MTLMSHTESDDDLRKAIALSLEEDTSLHNRSIIDLVSSDTEDDDLDAPLIIKNPDHNQPLKMDKVALETKTVTNSKARTPELDLGISKADSPKAVSQGFFSGLDRRRMESERLMRAQQRKEGDEVEFQGGEARKRKFGTSSLDLSDKTKRNVRAKHSLESHILDAALSDIASAPLAARAGSPLPISPANLEYAQTHSVEANRALDIGDDAEIKKQRQGLLSYKDQQSLGFSSVQFPDGVVKKTWAYGYPRADDIKIEEVFQKSDLEMCVLSAFQVDPEWVESKLNPKTKVVWVLQAKTEEDKRNIRADAPSNYRFCFPSMNGNINCMHSKLQLLAHPTHLRICIPSANLVPYDWGETGIMENVCFLIDLPRLQEGNIVEPDHMTEFGKELLHYLKALGLEESVTRSVRKFDFSRTSHLAFIHTIGGSHSGAELQRTGYCGLGNAVRKLGLDTDGTIDVDFVAASLGNINLSFLKSIYLAAQGDNGLTEYEWRTSKTSKIKAETPNERKVSEEVKKNFKIYFPTRDTVVGCKGGIGAGGTIFLQSKWYESETFPKFAMRNCKSRRNGMLMHSKMLFVRQLKSVSSGCKAWAYVGSANCSEAAWGRLVKDKSSKEPKLNCRNWECGVLIQAAIQTSGTSADQTLAHDGLVGMEIFTGAVPVPMIVPGEEYGHRRPWFVNEQ